MGDEPDIGCPTASREALSGVVRPIVSGLTGVERVHAHSYEMAQPRLVGGPRRRTGEVPIWYSEAHFHALLLQ
jgi:hypothetical protein